MRYLALDFETGNASPLSACALGASVFEDNQLVDEKISLIRPPECVGRFHWGKPLPAAGAGVPLYLYGKGGPARMAGAEKS